MFYRSLFNFRIKQLRPVRLIFAVYIVGFAYGIRNHIMDIITDGLMGYDFASPILSFCQNPSLHSDHGLGYCH